ncbi:MAG: hypothetical protein FWC78_05895 [Defluviitaleaceae bacterium]|nr:hypothetical protein [Defluviitaleaceae bacterium]
MYKVVMTYSDGTEEELDDIMDTMGEAEEFGMYMCSCNSTGKEVLHMSNPGDYPLDDISVDFYVIEV